MTNKPIWSPQGPVQPVAGYSGLWNQVYGEQYIRIDGQNGRRAFGMSVRNWGRYAYNQVIKAFITGDIGATALAQGKWVQAQDPADLIGTMGGKRNIITHTAINRAITVADSTALQQDISFNNRPVWAADKGGNGGGGKGGGL
jgi:hypothetical protein